MAKKLVSKTNHHIEIIGTLEVVYGVCALEPDADEPCGWSYVCSGTDINWDTQGTVEREGQRVFVDIKGNEFLESEIELIDCPENVDNE